MSLIQINDNTVVSLIKLQYLTVMGFIQLQYLTIVLFVQFKYLTFKCLVLLMGVFQLRLLFLSDFIIAVQLFHQLVHLELQLSFQVLLLLLVDCILLYLVFELFNLV